MKKLTTAVIALGLLAGGSVASACSLSAWSGTSTSAPPVGGPGETNDFARYSGLCAMSPGSTGEYVQDNNPTTEPRMIVRFYFLATSGAGTIFTAFDDEAAQAGDEVFSISYDSSDNSVTLTPAAGAAISATGTTGWNSVEVDWASGGAMSLWVNSDAAPAGGGTADAADATGTDGGAATVEAVQLGSISGNLGGLIVDDYESRRTTAVGQRIIGDANGDGSNPINIFDAVAVVQEIVNQNYAAGQPDCTEDGTVNIFDAVCIVQAIVNP